MTTTQPGGTNLVVVDGSNIATEGRSVPSLAQLNDAVLSLTSEFPDVTVTVVVDATFGHRIDKSEVAEFDEAVAHNELVTPPAGAIGRGDAFVLSIANKVGAQIFSNDSFQEFHGVYPWLFDEGRLIGGKPVPHVGWVFVNRVPVKGPLSRKARGAGKDGGSSRRTVSQLASLPMPVPTSPPPRRVAAEPADAASDTPSRSGRGRRRKADAPAAETVPAAGRDAAAKPAAAASPVGGGPVNDLLPFLDFVEHHPVGASVTGVVETYSSHGAYVAIGDVRGYVPLRSMGNPPPRSAREVMRIGERVTLIVASYAPPRRSIDLAVPGVIEIAAPEPAAAPAQKRRAKKAVAAAVETAAAELAAPVDDGSSRRRTRKQTATATPAKSAAAKSAAATPAKQAAAKKSAATAKEAATKKTSAEKTPAKKTPAKKAAPRKSAPTKAAAEAPAAPAKRSRSKQAAPAAETTDAPPSPELADRAQANAPKRAASSRGGSSRGASKRGAARTTAPGPSGVQSPADTVEPVPAKPSATPRRRRAKSDAAD